jgi:hypothetical protein
MGDAVRAAVVLEGGDHPALRLDRGEPGQACGLYVQIAARDSFQYPHGRLDLRFGRLQDRVPAGAGPAGKRWAEVFMIRVFGGGHQALPVGQLVGEGAVLRGQVGDPLGELRDLLSRGQGELLTLLLRGELGFGGAQRRSTADADGSSRAVP